MQTMKAEYKLGNAIKAKDTPWDAVLKGSVVCTVTAKLSLLAKFAQFFH